MINQSIPCSHTHFMLALNYSANSPGSHHWPCHEHNMAQTEFCLYNPKLKKQILEAPMKFAELASPDGNVFSEPLFF